MKWEKPELIDLDAMYARGSDPAAVCVPGEAAAGSPPVACVPGGDIEIPTP